MQKYHYHCLSNVCLEPRKFLNFNITPLESCICVNFRSLFSNDKCNLNIVTYVFQMSTLNQAGFRLLFHSDKSCMYLRQSLNIYYHWDDVINDV